jgi:hypothetical protein
VKGLQYFYQSFYGSNFFRHFRAPTDFKNKNIRNPGNQVTVKTPKNLWLQVYKRSGLWPCYIHIYNHGTLGNLNRQNSEKMVYDGAFFDFDITNEVVHQIKKELQGLRSRGLKHEQEQQDELREKLRGLIIDEHIVEPAINDAKDFAIKFNKWFGSYLILFFSGCKGAHGYTCFKPIKNIDINRVLYWFAKEMKDKYNYQTLDLSVNEGAKSRLSRVPYSMHQYTGLTVVPLGIDDSYDTIIDKSLNPVVEAFNREDYLSGFG